MSTNMEDDREARDLWERWRDAAAGEGRSPCPGENDLAEYLDGRASKKRSREIEEHISSCSACSDALVELRSLLGGELMDVPSGVKERARDLVRARPERASAAVVLFPARPSAPFEYLRVSAGWAAAAVLIVVACAAGAALGTGTNQNRRAMASAALSETIFEVPGSIRLAVSSQSHNVLNGGL